MSRSSGFKMNRDLHNFLRILGLDPQVEEVSVIHEIRAITGKYQTRDSIANDLVEMTLMESQTDGSSTMLTEQQSQEPVAANDNIATEGE